MATFTLCSDKVEINYHTPSVEPSSLEEFDSLLESLSLGKCLIEVEYGRVIDRRLTFLRNKSVFRFIPREVFHLIFLEASQTTELYRALGCPTLAISQTCRAWRSLALGLPCLWSTFTIEMGPYFYRPFPLDLYLRRSGSHLLSVTASFHGMEGCNLDQLGQILSQCAFRICSLTLDATGWNDGLYETLRAHLFLQTKSFQLNLISHEEYVEPSVLEIFPILSCFRFPVGLPPHNTVNPGMLVTVELDLSNDFEVFLRGCSQLETLTLTNTAVDYMEWGCSNWSAVDESGSEMSIALNTLRKLFLVVESRHKYVRDALGVIQAPNLEHLVIDATEQRTSFTDWSYSDPDTRCYPFHFNPELNSFLEQCNHTLSTLEMVGISMTDVDLLQTLQHRPLQSLRVLIVGDTRSSLPSIYPVTEQLVKALTLPSLLPRLMEANLWSAENNPNPPRLRTCLEMGQERNQFSYLKRLTVSMNIKHCNDTPVDLDLPPFLFFIVRDTWHGWKEMNEMI